MNPNGSSLIDTLFRSSRVTDADQQTTTTSTSPINQQQTPSDPPLSIPGWRGPCLANITAPPVAQIGQLVFYGNISFRTLDQLVDDLRPREKVLAEDDCGERVPPGQHKVGVGDRIETNIKIRSVFGGNRGEADLVPGESTEC